jgi:hypothetical protein
MVVGEVKHRETDHEIRWIAEAIHRFLQSQSRGGGLPLISKAISPSAHPGNLIAHSRTLWRSHPTRMAEFR